MGDDKFLNQDPDSVLVAKTRLRQDLGQRMRGLSPEYRASASARLCVRLGQQTAWQTARNVLLFVPLASEPDISPLFSAALNSGKLLCLPWFDAEKREYEVRQIEDPLTDLAPGYHRIPEPLDSCPLFPRIRLDFVLVPGVGFDESGHRLGRGKGYYDRLLIPVRGLKCGVAFEEQLVDRVPIEPHDLNLDCILTPVRWIFAGGAPVR